MSCEAPGVRIPPSPLDHEAKRYREIDTFCFYTFGASLLADEGVETKDVGLPLFAQWACKDPCGKQKGWALSGADQGLHSSQSLSALNSLQGVDFQPCRLFLCPKSCTKNAPTPFLRTSTGVFQIAHIPYIISHFLIPPDSTKCVV